MRKIKILVIDDEQDMVQLFKQKFSKELKSGDLAFHFSFTAKEAVEYLEQNGEPGVILILTDIELPDMNGLELLKILKGKFPELPIFMITDYANERNRRIAEEYGADDFISKPIDFACLRKKMFGEEPA